MIFLAKGAIKKEKKKQAVYLYLCFFFIKTKKVIKTIFATFFAYLINIGRAYKKNIKLTTKVIVKITFL